MTTKTIAGLPFTERHEERFWAKIEKNEDGCWIWVAGKSGTGYGGFRVGGKVLYPHRVTYELAKGPVPKGLVVRHGPECGGRLCVNPDHLATGTHADNAKDRHEGWWRLDLDDIPMSQERRETTKAFLPLAETIFTEIDAYSATKERDDTLL